MARTVARPRRRWPLVVVILLALTFLTLSLLSVFYIDLLWFQELGFPSVFWTTLWAQIALGTVLGLLFFALLYVNLLIVRRLAPKYRVLTPQQEIVERYRRAFEPYLKWLIPAGCVLVALVVGIGAARNWSTFLAWRNSSEVTFGVSDPLFHLDPAFYIFKLPFLEFLQGWLFSALLGTTVIVTGAHYMFGGIRPQSPVEKVTPQVKAHLSVLLGLIVLVQAWGFFLDRYELLTSERGVVTGASYTDVKAQLPALNILAVVAVLCAILFLINIRFRGWALPVIGVGLLVLVSVVVGVLIPAFVQKFSVEPQELQREQPYIEDNIEFTREAFGLDEVDQVSAEVSEDLPPDAAGTNVDTIANIRLWDPFLLKENYEQLQRIKPYYEFGNSPANLSGIAVDRYVLDGQKRVVMLSPREVSQDGIPTAGATWQNKHLVYTHGYGAAASLVNGAGEQGGPLFILRNIPPIGDPPELADELNAGEPRVYFGVRDDVAYVVARTGAEELDYQGTPTNDQEQVTSRYEGSGGIPVGGFFRKLLFSMRFQDVNLMISDLIEPDSRVMIYRSIQDRVPKAAPFLKYDGDPYAAIVDGRIVWIWDAYTSTDLYPYSQRLDLAEATSGQLDGTVNYMRNSVKAVVDAYDGTVTLYVADPEDPLIQVWSRTYPDLFTSFDEAPEDLRAHFRYPENLFQVQATQYANYHVTDPAVFYQKQNFWAIPGDPAEQSNLGSEDAPPMRPYYVLTKLPGEDDEEFSLILPFVPEGRQNMVAWIAARSDPEHYGEVVSFEFPSGRNVGGPVQVFNLINTFPRFSSERTLLGQQGSVVLFGNLLVIPLEDSFLYVQPVFVQTSQTDSFPELKRVIVVHGGSVGLGSTLAEALADSGLGTGAVAEPGEEVAGAEGATSDTKALLQRALVHFEKADEALTKGDLATYQAEIEKAKQLVRQAGAASVGKPTTGAGTEGTGSAAGGTGTGTGGTATDVTASPEPSPAASPAA
ncbi:MAG: UPF0182 family protein [Actinomycetota bacterium]